MRQLRVNEPPRMPRSIIDLGLLLASIVGGYSVSCPLLAAFEKLDPLTVVLLDVHPDYRD